MSDVRLASLNEPRPTSSYEIDYFQAAGAIMALAGITIVALGVLKVFGGYETKGFMDSLIVGSSITVICGGGVVWMRLRRQTGPQRGSQSQQGASSNPSPESIKDLTPKEIQSLFKVRGVGISDERIKVGHGEYILFHEDADGARSPISQEIFEQAYLILNAYSPIAIANSGSENKQERAANRYELLRAELKEIDPTLEVAFVPKTLYELIFIRECIQEDLDHGDICEQLDPFKTHKKSLQHYKGNEEKYSAFLKEQAEYREERKCWHIAYFEGPGDINHPGVKSVAYRLNEVLFNKLSPTKEGFSYLQLASFLESQISDLKRYHKVCQEIPNEIRIADCETPGPTTNFGYESNRGLISPMGIRYGADANIIRNALALECSTRACYNILLFRGGDFGKDYQQSGIVPYGRLFYGTSLFAGCIFDGPRTAFRKLRNEENAYVLHIPIELASDSLFNIPNGNTLTQLFGKSDEFRACLIKQEGPNLRKKEDDFWVHEIESFHLK